MCSLWVGFVLFFSVSISGCVVFPLSLAALDVVFGCVVGCAAGAAVEFAGAPQVPSAEFFPQPWKPLEDAAGANSLQ